MWSQPPLLVASLIRLAAPAHRTGALSPWLRHDEELGYGRPKRVGQGFERLDRRVLPTALDTPDVAGLEASQETERLLRQLFGHPQASQIPGHKGTHSHRARERTSCPCLIQALKVVLFGESRSPSRRARCRAPGTNQQMASDQCSCDAAKWKRTGRPASTRYPARTGTRRIRSYVPG